MSLQPGRYRHYKGRDYIVIGVARHSETEEELVVYRTDYGDKSLWVRPKAPNDEATPLAVARSLEGVLQALANQ